jgi:hypothetical protein
LEHTHRVNEIIYSGGTIDPETQEPLPSVRLDTQIGVMEGTIDFCKDWIDEFEAPSSRGGWIWDLINGVLTVGSFALTQTQLATLQKQVAGLYAYQLAQNPGFENWLDNWDGTTPPRGRSMWNQHRETGRRVTQNRDDYLNMNSRQSTTGNSILEQPYNRHLHDAGSGSSSGGGDVLRFLIDI